MWDDGGEQLGWMYGLGLRESHLILHRSAWSLGHTLTDVEGTEASFEAGPSTPFVVKALLFLLWSYGQIVGLVMDHFEMPDRQGFADAFQRAHDGFGPSESH